MLHSVIRPQGFLTRLRRKPFRYLSVTEPFGIRPAHCGQTLHALLIGVLTDDEHSTALHCQVTLVCLGFGTVVPNFEAQQNGCLFGQSHMTSQPFSAMCRAKQQASTYTNLRKSCSLQTKDQRQSPPRPRTLRPGNPSPLVKIKSYQL